MALAKTAQGNRVASLFKIAGKIEDQPDFDCPPEGVTHDGKAHDFVTTLPTLHFELACNASRRQRQAFPLGHATEKVSKSGAQPGFRHRFESPIRITFDCSAKGVETELPGDAPVPLARLPC